VVFDWGTDLTILSITGNIGNLLPDEITKGSNVLKNSIESITAPFTSVGWGAPANVLSSATNPGGAGAYMNAMVQETLMKTSSYYELLQLSPKYLTFKDLEYMYINADADTDIILLEFGDMATYRGYFQDFKFDMDAKEPWNWKYSITFIILAPELGAAKTRWDAQYNQSNVSG
jgi:hypothetical protein